MNFVERLEEKMLVDRLAASVNASLEQAAGVRKLDRESMRELLARTDYAIRRERDLELYVREKEHGKADIMVLDNELPVYPDTNVEQVLILKSPTVKEMVYNAVKILYYDKKTVATRGRDTVEAVRREILDRIDLSFTLREVEDLGTRLKRELSRQSVTGVLRFLRIFGTLLDYKKAPASLFDTAFAVAMGKISKTRRGSTQIGPAVIYVKSANRLLWVKKTVDLGDEDRRAGLLAVANQTEKADAADDAAVDELCARVIEKYELAEGRRADLQAGKTMLIQ